MLDNDTKNHLIALLQNGCERDTAAHFCGLSAADVQQAIDGDEVWRRDVLRAEAAYEFRHLQKLQQAAGDSKNWRISVWCLESRWPERYARRAFTVAPQQLRQFVDQLAGVLNDEVSDVDCRERVLNKLATLVGEVESQMEDSLV